MRQIITTSLTLIFFMLVAQPVRAETSTNLLMEKFINKYAIGTNSDADLLSNAEFEKLSPNLSLKQNYTDSDWHNALSTVQTLNYLSALPVFLYFSDKSGEKQFLAQQNIAKILFREAGFSDEVEAFSKYRLSYIWQRRAYNTARQNNSLPEHGVTESLLAALCELGVAQEGLFKNPIGQPCAIQWYRRAAEKGNAPSLTRLAFHYLTDASRFDKNPELAYTHLTKALNSDDHRKQFYLPDIHYGLALLTLAQIGTDAPRSSAIPYLKLAANQNIPEAKYLLGLIYEHGLFGLVVDQMEAGKLKQEAKKVLTDAQIDAANQMIMEIKS